MLQEVCRIGSDPKVTCMKSTKNEPSLPGQSAVSEDEPVSDEEEYDEDRLPVPKVDTQGKITEEQDIVRYYSLVSLSKTMSPISYNRNV